MKNVSLLFLLFLCVSQVYCQNVIYTISASIDDQTTHLDSILFVNLDNETRFTVGDLPSLSSYHINLSTQQHVTSIDNIQIQKKMIFRLARNTPGNIDIQFLGMESDNALVTIFNMAGQIVFSHEISLLNSFDMITVSIPNTGIYLLNMSTSSEIVNFKVIGSTTNESGTFSISKTQSKGKVNDIDLLETFQKSLLLHDGFDYQQGDSIRVTAYLDGYYAQPYATRIDSSLSIHFPMQISSDDTTGTFIDNRDGQTYKWVKIGNQVWMAENLRYLPEVVGPNTRSEATPYYYVYGYEGTDVNAAMASENFQKFGVLYNWPAAMAGASSSINNPSDVQGVCPLGWHLPSDNEWAQLVEFIGDNPGKKLKATYGWDDNGNGSNIFGFEALPGGGLSSSFFDKGSIGVWWTATYEPTMRAWVRAVGSHTDEVGHDYHGIPEASSVRCVRDPIVPPEAGFSANRTSGKAPLNVAFSDQSLNPVRWLWDFGDGNTSEEQNPLHRYKEPGSYTVELTVTNAYGTDTAIKKEFIQIADGQIGITGIFTDNRDNNIYKWVKIGNQIWMAENLNYHVENSRCYDDNDTNCSHYGRLYSWNIAMASSSSSDSNPSDVRGVCPTGWHIPSDEEWTQLENYLYDEHGIENTYNILNLANALRSCRQVNSPLGGECNTSDHPRWAEIAWWPLNHFGTDEFGFSALPGGHYGSDYLDRYGFWWTSTESFSNFAFNRSIYGESGYFDRDQRLKSYAFSVRCVRDYADLSLEADFFANPDKGIAPLNVNFTDITTNYPTSWHWDFGDGNTSNQQNPSHTYNTPGNYSVKLIVTSTFGSDTLIKPDYIQVTEEQVAETGTFLDARDGKAYKWVEIGDQVWMAENLNYDTQDSWCYDNNEANCDHYGRLYTWDAAMNGALSSNSNPSWVQGVCPPGWHLPSDAEWTQLVDYVVSQGFPNSNVVDGTGNALKSCRQVNSPIGGDCSTSDHPRWNLDSLHYGTDEFGFSVLPGGYRWLDEVFYHIGGLSIGWSSTEFSFSGAWVRQMWPTIGFVRRDYFSKGGGFSVRCVQSPAIPPGAGFSATLISGYAPLTVNFTDHSSNNPTSWYWDFGDGNTSDQQNPSHIYLSPGNYSVELTVTNAYGSDTEIKADFIEVNERETGTFTDSRDGQTYKWVEIGDQVWMAENLRYLPEVVHPANLSETQPFYYVYGYGGFDPHAAKATENFENYGVLYNWPAAMNGEPSSGTNPSGVQGVCPPGWHVPSHDEWTQLEQYVCTQLGNSDCDSKFPYNHTPGWRGTNEGNALKSCQQIDSPLGGLCNVSDHPRWGSHGAHYGTDEFGFSALPGSQISPYGSRYLGFQGSWWSATDYYSSSRAWHRDISYSDGNVLRNIEYKVYGFSVRCVQSPAIPPKAEFSANPTSGQIPLTVNFADQSTNNPTSWHWDFGDGNTSDQQNPSHIYIQSGIFSIQLIVNNLFGADTIIRKNYISVEGVSPVAEFIGSPTSGIAPLTVNFTDQSAYYPTTWHWDFGDGNTSEQQNPSNTYDNPGNYSVQLIVSSSSGTDTLIYTDYIRVAEGGKFTDPRDNQIYTYVKIGDQIWMAENLRYLPEVAEPETGSETQPFYYVYGYDGTDVNSAKATENYLNYGVLYNWPAAMNEESSSGANPSGVKGVCPPGWHVPSHDEWTQLEQFICNQLGNADCASESPYSNSVLIVTLRGTNEGNSLKSCRQVNSPLEDECGTSDHPRWDSDRSQYGSNEFGFSALPGGRVVGNNFYDLGGNGAWWTSTEYSSTFVHVRYIFSSLGKIERTDSNKSFGISVRCLQDN